MQKANCTLLRAIVASARQLGLNSISFLAADITSEAFNRPGGWAAKRQDAVALGREDIAALEQEVELLIQEHWDEIASGFVAESAEKLRRIVRHFRAQLGEIAPVAPTCNAPWVSAVIEADGTVRPCFFHRPIGNVHEKTLIEIVNGDPAVEFRRQLDIAANPVCPALRLFLVLVAPGDAAGMTWRWTYPACCVWRACIFSNAARLRCSISAGVRSSLCVPIDQPWPKGSTTWP